MNTCISAYGASPNGSKLSTEEIQLAIDTVAASGGGRVVVPAGTFYTSSILLKDNIELHLEPGATLKFSDNPTDYPLATSRWEGVKRAVYRSCIYAENASNIAITGFGCIDGNGSNWWKLFRNHPEQLVYPRPTLISFQHCQRITLKDFQVKNSPSWTIHPLLSSDITIENLSITNPADSPNTDGIDPECCSNVRISNCKIDVGDDCIVIKSGTESNRELVPSENITITNCQMLHGHGGIVFGSEMSGSIRKVAVSNCIFSETDRGIRLKSFRGRGGIVEDITVSNLIMDQVICPFVMNLYYPFGSKAGELGTESVIDDPIPQFQNIHFANISAKNVQASAGFIYGLPDQAVQNVTFNDITIAMAKNPKPAVPAMIEGLTARAGQGFFLKFAENICFNQVSIENHLGEAFQLENSHNIEKMHCRSNNQLLPDIIHP